MEKIDDRSRMDGRPRGAAVLASLLLLTLSARSIPGLADQRADPCASGPIASARIEGCELARCKAPDFEGAVLDLAGVTRGRVLGDAAKKTAVKRILGLGFFRSAAISCSAGAAGVDVVISVLPRKRIGNISITGHRYFYESDLEDRLPVQKGDYLDPESPKTSDVLEQVRDVIKRAYMKEGFHGTRVDTDLRDDGDGLVNLTVTVVEGERLKMKSVKATLEPSDADPKPAAAAWSCPVIKSRDLRNWAGLAVGNPYTEGTVRTSVQNLKRALRSLGFSGLEVKARFDPESRNMSIRAVYDSCHLLRFFVRDREQPGRLGFKPLDEPALLEVLPFGDSGVFDLTESSIGAGEVRRFFLNRGFLMTDVKVDYRPRNRIEIGGRTILGPNVAGVITYFVTLNGKREIRRIRIHGNDHIDTDLILGEMNTTTYDFFGDPGALLPEQVYYDLDRIRALYARNGFNHMGFEWTTGNQTGTLEVTREGRDRVLTFSKGDKAFKVRSPTGTEGIFLEIGVREGRRDTLGKVVFRGVKAFTQDQARAALGLESGGPFSPRLIKEAARRLQSRYSNEGYLGARVSIGCEGHEPDVAPGECAIDKVDSGRVDLTFDVDEGRRTHVRAVFVEGNVRTLDQVILKDFPARGEPYRIQDVADAVKGLKNLGIFTSVQVRAVGADEDPPGREVVLVVTCREDRTRFLDIAVGFEDLNRSGEFPAAIASVVTTSVALEDRSSTGFGSNVGLKIPDILITAEVRYSDLNFLGRGKRLYLPLKYGLSTTAWDRYAAFTPSYVDPRFFARGLTFRFTPFIVYDRATTRLDLFHLGAEMALSKELYPHLHGSLTYEIAEVKSRDPAVTTRYSAFRLENKLRPSLTYDRLDHPIDPKKGGLLQASLSYINAYISDRFNNYLKFEATGKFFWSIRDYLTFGFMARFGTSQSFGGSVRLPDEERFTLGGNRGVRGFANDGVAQYNPDGSLRLERLSDGTLVKPHGGNHMISGSVEIRFPIIRKMNLNGAIFYDFGALAERLGDFSGASFRHSAGVGLRFLIANAVPIRLDYGVILDRRCSEVDPQSGICVLREEVGNIHFGLLYTF
ncbi:MAG: BamA/TamA family outer membrane protein [Deltaproteobacteria bacterium]|nr:BamA/TamA family outer membrane protein [Deltaproteobacteria bacterium]